MSDEISRDSLEVGDETIVVVTDTNAGEDRDPITQIDGMTTFLKLPPHIDAEFGKAYTVRIADVSDRHYVATVISEGGRE